MYSIEQINHIIYNNRTYEGTVKNFMPNLDLNDINLLLEIDKQIKFVNKLINKDSSIIIDKNKLDLDLPDIQLLPEQLFDINISSRNFSEIELDLIQKKKIPFELIEQYDISPLSQIKDLEKLEILGVTTHPIMKRLIGDGISDGLIIPLYKDGKLINSLFRKTNELTRLKYGITVSTLNFWGDEILEGEEIWICEGLFDMMALRQQGKRCISAGSCNLSDFQYFIILKNKPSLINIFTDNDPAGYRSAMKSRKMFNLNGIDNKIYSSKKAKDAAEHFFELELNWDEVEEINVTFEMIKREQDFFDFLKYLEDRKF